MTEKNTSGDGGAIATAWGHIRGAGWHQHKRGGVYVAGHVGTLKFTAIGKQAQTVMDHPKAIMVIMTGTLIKDKEGHCCRCSTIASMAGSGVALRIVDAAPAGAPVRPRISVDSEGASSC